ncbi:S1 RNA-binding domain-containing protein [Anaeropeptidivorans aminofermentans]|jgi:general stress protein 13/S1 RNA binding domain protein|uniref:S1 RNA-binding domain-containing protein n=1 Tax=Anaeropeptidivorans aminofermentans TaxID=2934315 RepID=UPI00202451C5|nr:S1 RNA-binding domain-containing protein [Anaeropeptidivorans aminofermentans]
MSIEVGSIIEGKVVRIKPFGAIVSIGDNLQGLVHISHISNSFVQDINEHLAVGDIIKVKVLSVDEANNKIALSIKEAVSDSRKNDSDSGGNYVPKEREPQAPKEPLDSVSLFEEKFKEWVKSSNERQAGINKRNKRR